MRKVLSTIVCFAITLLGCEKSETITIDGKEYMSASACAKSMPNGQVVDCDPSEDDQDNLRHIIQQSQIINRENPGPIAPDLLNLEKTKWHAVKAIDEVGVIKIENGVDLYPAGLKCVATPTVDSLKGSFLRDSSAKLAYTPSGLKKGNIEYAYIWVLGSTDNPEFGPTLSSINENLIVGDFCEPEEQKEHKYHQRYQRIRSIW
jgi:hypothetical protein